VLVAFGTRPEALKLYPVITELRRRPADFRVSTLVTAQHRQLLDQVLDLFAIRPDHDLNVMTSGQTLSKITERTLRRIDSILSEREPEIVLVQGDTTTTFSVALAAFNRGIEVGHIEAGLRTGDRRDPFPEEINRRLVSVLANLHFAPTGRARKNLLSESISPADVFVTGNTIVDCMQRVTASFGVPPSAQRRGSQKPLILVTAHRRESFGEPMERICRAVAHLARSGKYEIIFPVHPNPQVRHAVSSVLSQSAGLRLCAPMEYREFLKTLMTAQLVITDSGGVQEEAAALGVPALVTRAKTERPEGIAAGLAMLVGSNTDEIVAAAEKSLTRRRARNGARAGTRAYGDGHASERVVQILRYHFGLRATRPRDYQL
jgi:UDP-N-acetylglucosamine 2-epimerase